MCVCVLFGKWCDVVIPTLDIRREMVSLISSHLISTNMNQDLFAST